MTEGMTTRSRVVEESIHHLNDRQDALLAKMEDLCGSVQQYAELFDTIQKSLATQQTVMSDMMFKLSKIERGPPPPLLSSPPVSPGTGYPHLMAASSAVGHPSQPLARLPKLEIPLFTCENLSYDPAPAIQWYHWLFATDQLTTWSAFVRLADICFGPSKYVNHEARLYKLRQQSSVMVYMSEFECLSTRVMGLRPNSLLNCFLSGLRKDIQRELYTLQPETLADAMGLAKIIEDKCNAARAALGPPRLPFRALPMGNTGLPTPGVPRFPAPPTTLPIKKLTPAEMAARRKRGLCFNCDSPFTRGHRCNPPQFLCLLVDEGTESPEEVLEPDPVPLEVPAESPPAEPPSEEIPSISFHAFTGALVPSTLKIAGIINGKRVTVLIDGGSTNNFLQTRLASHLGLTTHVASQLTVTVGNGEQLQCGGECLQVPLKLGEALFPVDLLLLPVFGADVVLGVHWLARRGPTLFDYKNLWMEFDHHGARVRLHGLPMACGDMVSPASLRRDALGHTGSQYFHLSVTWTDDQRPPAGFFVSADISAPLVFVDQLNQLIRHFTDIFSIPTGLPPARSFDHRIRLQPNTSPVNVRPCRYPHF
ncbi:uncharacterized protein LOC120263664 [Dioscorea cayenensis subsp. rotundata]|uniref:Uncharacterized protein LOC120263664 n=1 Tax=Dioscorea cayennensis subsp. rotundata TaxID=55577 RepID=A0AB40BM08_DIOCR|nr:uncharacterized protein LOC120263664 [Dioscorea cayenensis subsp. rotundata]